MEELAASLIRVEEEALWGEKWNIYRPRYPSIKLQYVTPQKTIHLNV
jgi:hypothetical protein